MKLYFLGISASLLIAASGVVGQTDRTLTRDTVNTGERRVALVIGNSRYVRVSPLENPVNDANDMALTLQALGFEVIKGTDANLLQMRRLIRQFGEKLQQQKGVGLFYYAGHGVEVRGKNFLVPVDADIAHEVETEDYAIDLNSVMRQMDAADNGFNIVILDACRNNPFSRGWNRSGDSGGLANVNAPTGTYIAFAAAPGSTASDGKGTRNGVFTGSLVKQLKRPGLKLEEVFKATREDVMTATSNKQVPWDSSSVKGDFYFKRSTGTSATAQPGTSAAKTETAQDKEAWGLVAESKDPEDLRGYISEFPAGFHRDAAVRKLDDLVWANAKSSADAEKVNKYLEEFPEGANAATARILARQLRSKSPGGAAGTAVSGTVKRTEPATAADPGSALGLYQSASAAFKNKNYDTAIKDASRAIDLDPSLAKAYETRCMSYLTVKDYRKANDDCNKAIGLDPDLDMAYIYRGSIAYTMSGDVEAMKPDSTRGYANMIANSTKVLSSDPNDTEALLRRAQGYAGTQNYASAVSDYNAVIRLQPDSAAAYKARAGAYAGQQNWAAAEQDYLRATELDPTDDLMYLMVTTAHSVQNTDYSAGSGRARGNYAIPILTRGIEKNPGSISLYSSRAQNYHLWLDDSASAISDYTRAVDLFLADRKPDQEINFLTAINGLADVYRAKGSKAQAIATLTRGVEVLPNNPLAYYYRASFYKIWMEDKANALADYIAGSQAGNEVAYQKINIDAVTQIDKAKGEELRRNAAEKARNLIK